MASTLGVPEKQMRLICGGFSPILIAVNTMRSQKSRVGEMQEDRGFVIQDYRLLKIACSSGTRRILGDLSVDNSLSAFHHCML